MPITYIICAAGEGTRFQSYFGSVPKSSIRLQGTSLLEWSLRSLPLYADDTLVLITQKKHRLREKMYEIIYNLYPFNALEWIELDALTRGQLETAFLARNVTPDTNSVVIFNCDSYFQSKSLVSLMQNSSIDGILPCAEAEGDAWSFCKVNAENQVIEVKEKERISPWASVGFYYFRNGASFFERAEKALKTPVSTNEYYVAPLYQQYIDSGMKIIMDRISLFKPMGTPEQIEMFWNISMDEVKNQNNRPVLVIDLDNTITVEETGTPYADKKPNYAVINKMHEFVDQNWEIIIYTSRRMETFGNDEAKIVADIGKITIDWLQKHKVPYDGLRFGKPYARNGFYVDDKAMTPQDFLQMDAAIASRI